MWKATPLQRIREMARALIATILFGSCICARETATVDAELKTVRIDSVAHESLMSVRADTQGRLFVGGREAIFVYEPNAQGGYHSRRLLYRFPPDPLVNDIEIRGNDLYVLTRSALYLIADGARKRESLQPKKLIWGVPRGDSRQGFCALAWGPEGDLYIALGAGRWGHWTFFSQPDGTKTPYSGAGCVIRCKPDASGLQVVARGLRHADGLVFDKYWNLFCCDSDNENAGRLLQIAAHAYFGDPSARADSLQPMLDGTRTSRIAGLNYYDETLLPEKYRRQLWCARGNDVLRLSIEPRGASFHATEYASLHAKNPGAITVGRGGRLFAIMGPSDLVMLTTKDDPAAHPFEPYVVTAAPPEKLWQELGDSSWQRRYRAHIEITRRGGDLLKQANKRLLGAKASDPALHHLIWLAAKSGQGSLHLLSLVDHADPLVRVQAMRALTEFPEQLREEPIFMESLLDEHPQVQLAAMSASFSPKIAWGRPVQQAIERGPACNKDTYLRQTAALLLAQKATRKQIEDLCARFDTEMRLAGVLAAGYRLTLPAATTPLAQHLPLGKLGGESAYVIDYADGKLDLRDHGRVGTFTIAEHWKADKHSEDQNLLFNLLRRMAKDRDETVRAQAVYFLELLKDPRIEQAPR
jgi:hypothetical protein